ncbi:ras-related protein Rab-39B-like [Corapipo altera]|uniref:ras-related protein Rab-39B-like n=1 Tax=Corapipo altera TaxID=415028 RepID=UPI000FD6620A|nr:ras-related protein Rab-39B-like [Corapipo altera]
MQEKLLMKPSLFKENTNAFGRQGGGNAAFLKDRCSDSGNLTLCCGSFLCRSITRAYYRNSVGGLLLFDITNRRSFQNVHEWLEETKVHVQPYQIVFVLVGHKCDLDTQRQVTRHEAEKLAAAYGMKYIETSARDAINVEKAFTDLTRDIYELVKRGDISIQEGWEGVKSGFVPNVVHSSEEVVKSDRRCLC